MLHLLKKKKFNFAFEFVKFCQFLVTKALGLDPDSPKILDPA
jgi:hypothetical protein